MNVTILKSILLTCLLITLGCHPNKPSLTRANPEENGFSPAKLDSLGAYLEGAGSEALIILADGEVVYDWGNTDRKLLVHSIRKALLNSLYGIYVANGTIDTSATLQALGIDDIHPLTETERTATVADLLKSRSGIYHGAAAVSEGMLAAMPERGTHQPGEAYYYNNWDFNTLGFILEQQTGQSIFDLFHQHIARPLGMEYGNAYITVRNPDDDWAIPDVDGFYQYEEEQSKYPAYHFRLSATDLARYGQLYLNKGKWRGRQIVPEEWIEVSTTPYSITNEQYGIGYGMLWNVLIPTESRNSRSFYHTGVGIHMLGIYPESRVVLVHRVDTEESYRFHEGNFYRMIGMVWGAREG